MSTFFIMVVSIVFLMFFNCVSAFADAPLPWQFGFQPAVTDVMESINYSHNFITFIMLIVMVFVFALIFYVILRFRRKGNDDVVFNDKNAHNFWLEIIWTMIPLVLVGFLTVSNIKVIKQEKTIPTVDLVLKAVGYQWYWGYSYPDEKYNVSFDSYMKQDNELKVGELRLLEVDNRIVLPIETNILLQVTSADVIHSWAVPSLGVKVDAIPGRLNETWFNIKKPGVYYGQCSELCGRLHGFMPIVVEAVSKQEFDQWISKKKKEL